MTPPSDPTAFVTDYLPARFAEHADALGAADSPGSLGLRVVGAGEWSLALTSGKLNVTTGLAGDVVLSVSLAAEDFPSLVASLPAPAAPATAEAGRFLRALHWDEETATLVRNVEGSILICIADAEAQRRVLLSPGGKHDSFDSPGCTVTLTMEDWLQIGLGKQHPTELFFSGRVQISGDAEIALALGGLFV